MATLMELAGGEYSDFLIAPDGTVVATHRGRHADDQWSVEELLTLAAAWSQATRPR